MSNRQTHRPNELITHAQVGGQSLFSFKATLSGAAPHAIAFKDYVQNDMADTDYRVTVGGEFASGACNVDESTITKTGFSLLGGADTEIAHVWVHGKIEGTPEG